MNISKNKIASLAYTLKNDDGEVLDTADENNPFLYMHGTGGIIKGLENALNEKTVNSLISFSHFKSLLFLICKSLCILLAGKVFRLTTN